MEELITAEYLRNNPDHIFVFGDNLDGFGYGGAAALRDEPNSYGFVTKLHPDSSPSSYFRPADYVPVYADQIALLTRAISYNPAKTYLISRVGAGLANKYGIWEKIIEPTIKPLLGVYPNVKFLWD